MKIVNKYMNLKNEYQDSFIFIKSGTFFHTFLNDAIILRYIFGYQIIENRSSFPTQSKDKVLRILK